MHSPPQPTRVASLTWLPPLVPSRLATLRVPLVILHLLLYVCILSSEFRVSADSAAGKANLVHVSTTSNSDNNNDDHHGKDPSTIHVGIQFSPWHYQNEINYIPTKMPVNASAVIYDDRYRNASLKYQWSTKNQTLTGLNDTHISITFDTPDTNDFLKLLVVVEGSQETGTQQIKLNIRDPVVVEGPNGKLFLERGELLNVTMPLTGTGPFKGCYEICQPVDSPDCDFCSEEGNMFFIRANKINVVRYLRHVGNYSLRVVVDNIASRVDKKYAVRISESVRVQRVAWVPIVSSIMAVLILLSGIALHLRFKRTEFTETADFDFTRHAYEEEDLDIWGEEQSFRQRVRQLLFCRDEPQGSQWDSMNSNLSGSRTRLM